MGQEAAFDPRTAFRVEETGDPSGGYAAQFAEQLAKDPGYPGHEGGHPPGGGEGGASGFGFINSAGAVAAETGQPESSGGEGGQMSMSDPGSPVTSGFAFVNKSSDEEGTDPSSAQDGSAGGSFSFVNTTAAVEYAPGPEEDLSAKVVQHT